MAVPALTQEGEQQAMPSNLRKSRMSSLRLVPVITRDVEVDPGGRYEGLPHFSHFGDQIKFVGGVNRPKLIQVRCCRHVAADWLPDMVREIVGELRPEYCCAGALPPVPRSV